MKNHVPFTFTSLQTNECFDLQLQKIKLCCCWCCKWQWWWWRWNCGRLWLLLLLMMHPMLSALQLNDLNKIYSSSTRVCRILTHITRGRSLTPPHKPLDEHFTNISLQWHTLITHIEHKLEHGCILFETATLFIYTTELHLQHTLTEYLNWNAKRANKIWYH